MAGLGLFDPKSVVEWLVAICNKRISFQLNDNEVREDKRGQQRDQNRWPWQEGIIYI
jgi:hypothetical protein